jgi:hypothetical protein
MHRRSQVLAANKDNQRRLTAVADSEEDSSDDDEEDAGGSSDDHGNGSDGEGDHSSNDEQQVEADVGRDQRRKQRDAAKVKRQQPGAGAAQKLVARMHSKAAGAGVPKVAGLKRRKGGG